MVNTAANQEREVRVAVERVVGFAQEFGEAHLNLACHAAFPLSLTPDLLYQIWANFVPEAPWTAVARVLLSRLCKKVGSEMYEMDNAVRDLLLRSLKKQYGQEQFNSLGEFLLEYVSQKLTEDDPDTQDLRQAQQWTALAYTKPEQAARELAQVLSDRVQQEDIGEVLRLSSLVETLSEPLIEAGFEPLLVYGQGMKSFISRDLEASRIIFSRLSKDKKTTNLSEIRLHIPSGLLNDNLSTNNKNYAISLIGYRGSGKTSYIAGLYNYPISNLPNRNVKVEFSDKDSGKDESLANILKSGRIIPSDSFSDPIKIHSHHLKITLQKKSTLWERLISNSSLIEFKLKLEIKEHSRETIDDYYLDNISNELYNATFSNKLMIFIDPTTHRKDAKHANLLKSISVQLDRNKLSKNKQRIAVVFTKCEQPQIYVSRFEPKTLARRRFPQAYKVLDKWETSSSRNIEYFCLSVMGTLGIRYPEPNSTVIESDNDGRQTIVRYPQQWKPFGVISPIYWLCTGKRYQDTSI